MSEASYGLTSAPPGRRGLGNFARGIMKALIWLAVMTLIAMLGLYAVGDYRSLGIRNSGHLLSFSLFYVCVIAGLALMRKNRPCGFWIALHGALFMMLFSVVIMGSHHIHAIAWLGIVVLIWLLARRRISFSLRKQAGLPGLSASGKAVAVFSALCYLATLFPYLARELPPPPGNRPTVVSLAESTNGLTPELTIGLIILAAVVLIAIYMTAISGLKTVCRAALVLLIPVVVIGPAGWKEMPGLMREMYSARFTRAFGNLVKEAHAFPVDERLTIPSDAQLAYCLFDDDAPPDGEELFFSTIHIPEKNRAKSPEETDIIVVARYGYRVVDTYSNGDKAMRRHCMLTAVDVREKTIRSITIEGGSPPLMKYSYESGWGSFPSEAAIEDCIASLISG